MWEIDLLGQCITGAYAVAVGFVFAFVYDIFKGYRKSVSCSRLSIFFQDIAAAAFLTLITFLLLIARCNGEVRAFVFIGEFIGFTLFRLILSRFVLKILIKFMGMLSCIKKAYRQKILLLSREVLSMLTKFAVFYKKILKKCILKRKNS